MYGKEKILHADFLKIILMNNKGLRRNPVTNKRIISAKF